MKTKSSLQRFFALAVTLLLMQPAASLSAATPNSADESAKTQEISIPFAPPLNQELYYRVTTTKPRGKEVVTAVLEQSLYFNRSETGYVMRVTPLKMSKLGGPSLDLRTSLKVLPAGMRALLRPYSYDLDETGGIVRIRDWEAIKKELAASVEDMATMMEADPAKRADAKRIAGAVISMYTGLTAEQAPAQLMKSWTPLFGYGGVVMDAGKSQTIETAIEAPMLPNPIPVQAEVQMQRGPGTVRMTQVSELDSDDVGAAVDNFFKRLAQEPLSDPMGRKNLEQASEMIRGMAMTHRTEIEFDAETGLPRRATLVRQSRMPTGEEAGQTDVVERIE